MHVTYDVYPAVVRAGPRVFRRTRALVSDEGRVAVWSEVDDRGRIGGPPRLVADVVASSVELGKSSTALILGVGDETWEISKGGGCGCNGAGTLRSIPAAELLG